MLVLPVLVTLLGTAIAKPLATDFTSSEVLQSEQAARWLSASTGGFTTLYVCKRIHGKDCEWLAASIAAGIALIFLILQRYGAISARDNHKEGSVNLIDFLAREFSKDGATFESIVDVTPHLLARYDSEDRISEAIVSVQSLKFQNATVDMGSYDFGNGDGHIYLPFDGDHITKRVEKRASGPGFKISYTTRLQSKLSRAHQIDMSQHLANYWNTRANCCNMHDRFGFVETDYSANFYYRIIPETVNFGLNYESVDVCGQMGGLL